MSEAVIIEAKKLDDKRRCCGRKPLVYKRPYLHLYCCRCDADYDPATGEQRSNWRYERNSDGTFTDKSETRLRQRQEGASDGQ